jgi:XTP/dITP diphosphohydrolase
MFQPAGLDRTFAELAPQDKHALSHRGRALRQLVALCFAPG